LRVYFAAIAEDCEIGGTFLSSEPFELGQSSFIVVNEYCSMTNAANYCAKGRGRLAHIPNAETQAFLENSITNYYDCDEGVRECQFWIGLKRENNAFSWKTPIGYTLLSIPGESKGN